MTTYKVIRKFFDNQYDDELIFSGITLEKAKAYCNDSETSSQTCTNPELVEFSERCGPWFCCYEEE